MKNQHNNRHYTNGVDNIFIDPKEGIPDGFRPGITSKKENRKLPGNNGKKHFTNGIVNVFCFEKDCPEGFKPGLTVHNPRPKKRGLSQKTQAIFDNLDKNLFIENFHKLSNRKCGEVFNISEFQVQSIAETLGVERSEEEIEAIKKLSLKDKRQKTEATCLAKYGTRSPAQSDIIKEKTKEKLISKYGVPYAGRAIYFLNSSATDEFKKLLFDKTASTEFMKSHRKEFFKSDLIKKFNCGLDTLNNWIYKFDLAEYFKYAPSHYEDEIADLFPQISFIHHYRGPELDGKEIDLYDPERKIGIEFNGTRWHSTLTLSDKYYHQNKSKLAEKAGIRLIHIFEYEWLNPQLRDKILLMLNICFKHDINKIYARKCDVRKISNSEAKELNETIHLQGHRNAQVTYGLFYENKLVQLMSFSKTKYNRNLKTENSWEIIRGCPGSNNIVVGGVSKLFNHFIKEYNPDLIFSYCDFNKFNGVSYEKLGMEFIGYTVPDLHYVLKDETVVNRNPTKYKENKKAAIAEIYGAGSKKYIWRKATK